MSDHIQPGQHPDADQLSAFIEHALSPHEREAMLLHLAVCTECREVVAFSLPPMEAAPAAPERRRWFSGMMLLWPAAALATATLLLVYARHTTTSEERPGVRNEIAQNEPPSAPASPALAPQAPSAARAKPPATARPNAQVEGARNTSSAAEPRGAAISSADATLGGVMDNEMYSNLPVATSGASQARPAAASPPAVSDGSAVAISGAAVAPPTQLDSTASASDDAVLGGVISSANASSTSIAGSSKPAPPAPETTNATVSENYALASEDGMSKAIVAPRLPSGAPVLSIVERGRQMVAIDTKNAVFLSNDGGVHWVAVAVPWKSRAVRAELVSSAALAGALHGSAMSSLTPSPARQGTVSAGAITAPAAATQAAQLAQLAPSVKVQTASGSSAPPGSVSGLVTDPTGAVVAGAAITLKGAGGQTVRTATSDRGGKYQLDGLPNGPYDLLVSSPGFEVLTLHAVAVDASQAKVVNLMLQVGAASETVTVTSAPMMIEPEPSTAPARAAVTNRSLPLFAITTDAGEHWTSTDGVHWQRR